MPRIEDVLGFGVARRSTAPGEASADLDLEAGATISLPNTSPDVKMLAEAENRPGRL
jgi:hypothetical protein